MNIYAANLGNIIGNGTLFRPDSNKIQEKINKSKLEKNIYQQQVDETNANRDGRIEKIMAKFYAGKKLNSDDLAYLAKNAPESYENIKEAIQQREVLEHQMEEADATLDVAMAYVNTLASAKNLADSEKGTNSWTLMGIVGQFSNAYGEFVRSPEYREKETEEIKAEGIQDEVQEKKELLEEIIQEVKDSVDSQRKEKKIENLDSVQLEQPQTEPFLTKQNKNTINILEENEKEEREKRRERRKNRKEQSTENFNFELEQLAGRIEKQMQFRKKITALYQSQNKETRIKSENTISKNFRSKSDIINVEV